MQQLPVSLLPPVTPSSYLPSPRTHKQNKSVVQPQEPQAQPLLLPPRPLPRVVRQVRRVSRPHQSEVPQEQQALQQPVPHWALHLHRQLQEVVRVHLLTAQLLRCFGRIIRLAQRLPQDLGEGEESGGFAAVEHFPLLLLHGQFEVAPVEAVPSRSLLDGSQYLVDLEGHPQEQEVVEPVRQQVQSLRQEEQTPTDVTHHCPHRGLQIHAFQRVFEQLRRRHPTAQPHIQHASEQRLEVRTDGGVGREGEGGGVDEVGECGDAALLEGTDPEQHLIEDDPQRPDIGPRVVGQSLQYFWRHVERRPHHGGRHLLLPPQLLAEAEICEFDDAVVEEDIAGFEVPMEDVGVVEDAVGLAELLEVGDGLRLGEGSLGADEFGQVAAVAVFVDQVVVVRSPQHLHEADDVFVLDLGEGCDFVVGELRQFGCVPELGRVHDLHRELLPAPPVGCPVDVAVLSAPHLLHQRVALHHLIHYTRPAPSPHIRHYRRPALLSHVPAFPRRGGAEVRSFYGERVGGGKVGGSLTAYRFNKRTLTSAHKGRMNSSLQLCPSLHATTNLPNLHKYPQPACNQLAMGLSAPASKKCRNRPSQPTPAPVSARQVAYPLEGGRYLYEEMPCLVYALQHHILSQYSSSTPSLKLGGDGGRRKRGWGGWSGGEMILCICQIYCMSTARLPASSSLDRRRFSSAGINNHRLHAALDQAKNYSALVGTHLLRAREDNHTLSSAALHYRPYSQSHQRLPHPHTNPEQQLLEAFKSKACTMPGIEQNLRREREEKRELEYRVKELQRVILQEGKRKDKITLNYCRVMNADELSLKNIAKLQSQSDLNLILIQEEADHCKALNAQLQDTINHNKYKQEQITTETANVNELTAATLQLKRLLAQERSRLEQIKFAQRIAYHAMTNDYALQTHRKQEKAQLLTQIALSVHHNS